MEKSQKLNRIISRIGEGIFWLGLAIGWMEFFSTMQVNYPDSVAKYLSVFYGVLGTVMVGLELFGKKAVMRADEIMFDSLAGYLSRQSAAYLDRDAFKEQWIRTKESVRSLSLPAHTELLLVGIGLSFPIFLGYAFFSLKNEAISDGFGVVAFISTLVLCFLILCLGLASLRSKHGVTHLSSLTGLVFIAVSYLYTLL